MFRIDSAEGTEFFPENAGTRLGFIVSAMGSAAPSEDASWPGERFDNEVTSQGGERERRVNHL